MSDLYDPETDGIVQEIVPTQSHCNVCGGAKKVWFGANGYDFEYPCPRCNKDDTP